MGAHKPSRHGYSYRKASGPDQQQDGQSSGTGRFRRLGLEWKLQPLYEQAGQPFGEGDAGLLLWLDFGRRTRSN